MQIEWRLKKFEILDPHELYAAIRLRNEVFVVEQHCVFQDADGYDTGAWHLLGFADGKLVAYTRLLAAGTMYAEPSIGRVVTSPSVRGSGAGKQLMKRSIEAMQQLFGRQTIRIGAQLYLQRFYESLGFEKVSEVYLEDGIQHIYMLYNYNS